MQFARAKGSTFTSSEREDLVESCAHVSEIVTKMVTARESHDGSGPTSFKDCMYGLYGLVLHWR